MQEPRNFSLFFDYFANRLADSQRIGHPDLPPGRRNAR